MKTRICEIIKFFLVAFVFGTLLYMGILYLSYKVAAINLSYDNPSATPPPRIIETVNQTIEKPVYIDRPVEQPSQVITVYTDRIVEKEVIKTIPFKYEPRPFASEAELRAFTDNWTPWYFMTQGSIDYSSNLCQQLAYAFTVDAVNAGYLTFAQIDPSQDHMLVAVPIYSTNRYLFVDPQTKTITKWFCGREWRIN